MPDLQRQSVRMICNGIDLVHAVDRMPEGYFPYLFNTRVLEEGRIEGRPGYSLYLAAGDQNALHSIRRLNFPSGYLDLVGNGTDLQGSLNSNTYASLASGFSGNPLSLLTFRPEQSPESWMYVWDANKQLKIRGDQTIRDIGVAPPQGVLDAEYGAPAEVELSTGQSVTGWTGAGATNTVTLRDRAGGLGPTISAILYNSGSTGWACINPANTKAIYPGERMQVLLASGAGNQEQVTVREIHPAIVATTIAAISYDSGVSGACSMVLTNNPADLARNSLLQIGSEIVRILAVVLSPDGTTYSVRCVTASTHSAGDAVSGLLSWYVYTTLTHAAAETITTNCVYATVASITPTSKVASIALLTSLDVSKAGGRPVSLADDYMHISFWATNAPGLVTLKLYIDIDANTTALGNAFTNNYLVLTLTPTQIYGPGGVPTAGTWVEIVQPLSAFVAAGPEVPSQNLSNVKALKIEITMSVKSDYAFDWWYIFGTYGPTIQPNSPVGYLYQSRNRDSTTGAASVPGPQTRYELFPLREQVLVTPQTSAEAGVDSLDIYRQGGTLTDFTYDGTVANNPATPLVFSDNAPDTSLLSNPVADLTLLQPWPTLVPPWRGVVDVIGTTVLWKSGDKFDTKLLSGTVILINGIAYQTYGQPSSTTRLELTASAGSQSGVGFVVGSPVLAAQSLPYAFGPLEGPLSPVAFGLGDRSNAGTLYWTNFSDLDAASDKNTLELCAPSEPLVSGQVWNGLVICGSRDNLYLIRYSYLQAGTYQFARLPSPSGYWARWATCRGPDGIYFLGRDGIYKATQDGADIVGRTPDGADPLYPLFPHDGQPAAGANGVLPVDMTQLAALRLSCCDFDIYFDYKDTAGNSVTLRYEIPRRRWFLHSYASGIALHYLVEEKADSPNDQEIMQLGRTDGNVYLAGGSTDNGVAIQSLALTPSFDGGDQRGQKLYMDWMTDADGSGSVQTALFFNNDVTNSLVISFTVSGARQQFLENLASLVDLRLYRNIAVKYAWSGGPAGPRIYAFEATGYAQPMLVKRINTQFIDLSFPGWKHFRRFYPGVISLAPIEFTIKCQDGRVFQTTIPSTGGQFKVQPLMIPQNCKDLSFAFEVDGGGTEFAAFPDSFTLETKEWVEPSYIELAILKA